MKKSLLTGIMLCLAMMPATAQRKSQQVEPVLPTPTAKQVEWQKMETYAFIHFGLNTFNDKEWGYGNSDVKTFNPKKLDCEQWAKTLAAAGMKGVIITAKHHDGFCLWPTHTTDYCIRNTPYKNGEGDIVGELSKACKKYGLKFGVYLSPWDRNQTSYGSEYYVGYYQRQLKELLSNYGDVFEVWFDGANGGDGWYGGAQEKRTIDRRNYYQFPKLYQIVDSLQPQATIFGDGGPGCRWVGNESGFAGETCWSMIPSNTVYPGYPNYKQLQYGWEDGDQWTPAECDVSIRPGWFYHESEDCKVKTVDELCDLYYKSVGHNATFLLNFPVDKDGLIHPIDSANAVNFHKKIQQELAVNVLKGITPKVDTSQGKHTGKYITDNQYDTYWASNKRKGASIEFRLPKAKEISRLMLQEYIPLGQRVKAFSVYYLQGKNWVKLQQKEETTTIGYKRILRFDKIKTNGLRIVFDDARGCPCINNVAAFEAQKEVNNEKIIFLDDFNTTASIPNPKVWKLCDFNKVVWAQHFEYVKGYENVRVEDGYLKLKASKTDGHYKNGGIHTIQGFDKNTRVEVRAKLTKRARGLFPAIWQMPINGKPWPKSGEVDIMEWVQNTPMEFYQTVHTYYINGETGSAGVTNPNRDPNFDVTQFHVYAAERNEDAVIFYVDGKETFRYNNQNLAKEKMQFPFCDLKFDIILNCSLGGTLNGQPTWPGEIHDEDLPAEMWVDWVKVIKCK